MRSVGGDKAEQGGISLFDFLWKRKRTTKKSGRARRSPFLVAVDGPAASGKGTVAKAIAEEFDFAHLDSGSLYRRVAYLMVEEKRDAQNKRAAVACAKRIGSVAVDDKALRTTQIADVASLIAPIPKVRAIIPKFQRDFARKPPGNKRGVVIDGRDIGSVVLPYADVKFFVTASVEERARRRWRQLVDSGEDVTLEEVTADISERDRRDRERHHSPLAPADDAIRLDTTEWELKEMNAHVLSIVRSKLQ